VISRTLAAKVLLGIGGVGVAASLVGMLVGLRTVAALDDAVVDSGALTAQALVSLDSSVALAQETIATLEDTVGRTETTTRELAGAFREGEALFVETAELSEEEIAPSVAAVQDALPGLIEAAAVIDGALVALSAVPFGPTYEPPEPFDESLRRVERELDGLPEHLQDQAELIREAGASLGAVREGTTDVADHLATLHERLRSAAALLDGYAETASEAAELVADSQARLGRQLQAVRIMIVVLGIILAAGQVLPLSAGWFLLRPERFAAFIERD
jgi:phage-related tail protein